MSTVAIAENLASIKHYGQVDKAGKPYITHPARVAAAVYFPEAKMVAWLHDVLEDTDTTAEDLLELGFSAEVVSAVIALTKKPGELRIDAAHRTAKNCLAVVVKIADVQDNMDLSRLPVITEKDLKRQEEYKLVMKILQDALKDFKKKEIPL